MLRNYKGWLIGGLIVAAVAALLITSMNDADHGGSAAGNDVDRAFTRQMIAHHRLAVDMANVAKDQADHPQIARLAEDIIAAQNREIHEMASISDEINGGDQGGEMGAMDMGMNGSAMGHTPGMSADARMLGMSMSEMGMSMSSADLYGAKPFDRAFIDMMVPHHRGAVRMARVVLEDGDSAEVERLARGVIETQAREIGQMRRWRARWYGG